MVLKLSYWYLKIVNFTYPVLSHLTQFQPLTKYLDQNQNFLFAAIALAMVGVIVGNLEILCIWRTAVLAWHMYFGVVL